MSGLTSQLQADAIDPSVPVSSLLRKVKIAAVKLQLAETADWVDAELNGYGSRDVPDYRIIQGQPKINHPRQGWVPFMVDAGIMETLSNLEAREPIATLEVTLGDPSRTGFYMYYPAAAVQKFNELFGSQYPEMALHVGRSTLAGIVERVRTIVLDWSLELEGSGIMGEGLSFTPKEKRDAAGANITIAHFSGSINSNSGDVSGDGSKILVGSHDASKNYDISGEAVFSGLDEAFNQSVKDQFERERLLGLVADMKQAKGVSEYGVAYRAFVALAADYMGLIAPFIPALTLLLAG